MTGIRDLLGSERGTFAILVLVVATLLAILHVITGPEWVSVVGTLITFLMTAKTVSHYIESKTPSSPPSVIS